MIEFPKVFYLDYNSTTPVDPRVLEDMMSFLKGNFANPSSAHRFGQVIDEHVIQARERVADFVGANANEIVFTSGATEAINLALKGTTMNRHNQRDQIITLTTEHKAVLDSCSELERNGLEVQYLAVKSNGLIDLELLRQSIGDRTLLVTVMLVNNETGVIQPIKEMAKIAHEKGALFMTDATQAAGKIEIDVNDLGVDLLCFSGHKMYAPKGIGALYVKNKIKLYPQIHGGGHEQGLRSGTLNVPGIMGLARACDIATQEMHEDERRISELRDLLETGLLEIPGTFVVGEVKNRIYNTTNVCFPNVDANVMIGRLKDIAVSNGSACSSAIIEPSHVLKGMGLSDEDAFASIRFSLGKFSTFEDIQTAINKIKELF